MEATRAVEKLTDTHSEMIDGAIGTSEPLLTLIWEARYPNLGRTKGGGGSGDVLDVTAMTIYENIDGIVRSWLAHFREHSTGDLLPLVQRLHQVLQAEHAGGRLEDEERMFGMFGQWVQQIEDHFDPPKVYEITGVCPECEAERIPEGDEPGEGERDERPLKWAVRVDIKPGRAIIPECHSCGEMWAGQTRLIELSESMETEIDWVALRELTGQKVDVPENSH